MRSVSITVIAGLLAFAQALPCVAGQTAKADELISLHHLDTSVSIGNYYLKQESLLSIRSYLARVGREQGLGAEWNRNNPWWRQAEESLLEKVMDSVDREFSDLAWLRPQWGALCAELFSDRELEALIAHFRTDVGSKQAQIIDHTISTHVMMTLSFSDKLKQVPGIEAERSHMQALWNDEDERMRFSIEGSANSDGQAFALSPLGKKYFTTLMLNLTGIVNRRIDEVALQRGREVEQLGDTVRPFVEGFRRGQG